MTCPRAFQAGLELLRGLVEKATAPLSPELLAAYGVLVDVAATADDDKARVCGAGVWFPLPFIAPLPSCVQAVQNAADCMAAFVHVAGPQLSSMCVRPFLPPAPDARTHAH